MNTAYRTRIYDNYATRFMDQTATFDAAASTRWGKAYDWYFRNWLPADKGAHILDLACGSGRLLHYFRDRGYSQVSGVDTSPEQVNLSRQVVKEVYQEDVLAFLATRREQYDLITGLDIIEHFHKDEVLKFLDGCHDALRTGGRLILQTPNADTPWGTYHRYNDFTHEVCFQSNSLGRLCSLCGFERVETREQGPVPIGYSLPSSARWLLWQGIRLGLKFYNFVETGTTGSGVFTRVFLASAVRK